jgi:23S rRNA (adenine2030-N6)-methyltransferase
LCHNPESGFPLFRYKFMLSYRHAFHAGNHADVLKHFIEAQLLRYLAQKEKPFWYIDTHAGAGCYSLVEGYATVNAEYQSGIARLWLCAALPASLADYVTLVKAMNPDGQMRLYPGSPLIAQKLLRPQDKMHLFELHPSDAELIQKNFAQYKQATLYQSDGFSALKALLPPLPRRALVLIDPPYEDKKDYQRVITALRVGLERFATGIYAVWYPLLQRPESRQLPEQLKQLPVKNWLNVSLSVHKPSEDGFGMHGSGMFILNPPWTLHQTLQQVMPCLSELLSQGGRGDQFMLEQHHSGE